MEALFPLFVILAIGTVIVKVAIARSSARRAGMDPNEATAVTLLGDNGLEATYLAASLRDQPPAASAPDGPTPADRLRDLEDLRRQGLITEAEYAAKRAEILDQL
jgi:hypothetical protein